MTLRIEHLSFSYPGKEVYHDLNLAFPSHGFIFLGGENGSGKTTLLKLISLCERPNDGRLLWQGENYSSFKNKSLARWRKRNIAFLFQDGNRFSFASPKEMENIDRLFSGGKIDKKKGDKKRTSFAFQGERSLLLALSLLDERKKLILIDEATSSLSIGNALKLISKIKEVSEKSLVIFASHDPLVQKEADFQLFITKNGKVEGNLPEEKEDQKEICSLQKQNRLSKTAFYIMKCVLKKRALSAFFAAFAMSFIATMAFFIGSIATLNPISPYARYLQNGDELVLSSHVKEEFAHKHPLDRKTGLLFSNSLSDDSLDEEDTALAEENFPSFFYTDELGKCHIENNSSLTPFSISQKTYENTGETWGNENKRAWIRIKNNLFYGDCSVNPLLHDSYLHLNLNRLDQLQSEDPLYLPGSLWDSPSSDFSTFEGRKKAFGIAGENYFLTKGMLQKRGIAIPLDPLKGTFYVPTPLKAYLPTSLTHFLSEKEVDYGRFLYDYPRLGKAFEKGIRIIYDENIAKYLGNQEILVSQEDFASAQKSISFKGKIHCLVQDPSSDSQRIFGLAFEPHVVNHETHLTTRLKKLRNIESRYSEKEYHQMIFYPFIPIHVLSCLLLYSFLALKEKRKNSKDSSILLQNGFTPFEGGAILTSWLLISPWIGLFVGLAVGWLWLGDYAFWSLSINPWLILIMTVFAFLLDGIVVFAQKTKKN